MTPYLRPEGTQLRQGGPEPPAAARREAHPLDLLLAIMGDPRNSWLGGPGKILHGAEALPALVGSLGPLFKSGRGWEVLREYIAKGGTPASLRALLRERGLNHEVVGNVARDVREGTDLAAPPYTAHNLIRDRAVQSNESGRSIRERYPEGSRWEPPTEQRNMLQKAARTLVNAEPTQGAGYRTAKEASDARAEAAPPGHAAPDWWVIPAGNQGQAAYQAISSRMGRLMDDPNFLAVKRHFVDLPPVSDAHYYEAFPMERTGGGAYADLHNAVADSVTRHMTQIRERLAPVALDRLNALAAPRTFSAAENQRTSDLNRRADQSQ